MAVDTCVGGRRRGRPKAQLSPNGDFDLCLTDMRLPDGDGLELVSGCKAIRR